MQGINGKAQNIIPNPSFEVYDTCPNNLDQIRFAIGWSSYRNTPDYFNSCSPNGGYSGIPLNKFGFQYPRTGNAYAGFFSIHTTAFNYREYIGIQLNQALIIGHKYYGAFFVNRVTDTNGQNKNIATNKLGMRFSTLEYSNVNPSPINNYAQIYTDSIITDTLNWVKISGFFIADSAYQFLSIGNFFSDSVTTSIKFDSTATGSYYFLDDISLIDSTTDGINELKNFDTLMIFPNPARDWIEIGVRDLKNITIYDILGNKCFQSSVTNSYSITINILSFKKGIYFLKIETDKKDIYKKILIQ